MPASSIIKANAALSICESTLLCLTDLKILNRDQVFEILTDAISAHRIAAHDGQESEINMATADEIISFMQKGNILSKG